MRNNTSQPTLSEKRHSCLSIWVVSLAIMISLSPSSAQSSEEEVIIGIVGGILGAAMKESQIKAAKKSWGKVDDSVKQCLVEEHNVSPRRLANKGIKATHKNVTPYIEACKELIAAVNTSWEEVDGDVKQCLIHKHNISPEDLAEKRIGAADRRVGRYLRQCQNDIEQAQRQKAMLERARLEQEEIAERNRQARAVAEAKAKTLREKRRRDLVAKYGSEVADAIISGKILVGMTRSQVIEARGQPDSIEKIPDNDELWIYGDDRVFFESGRVIYVSS